MSSLPPEQEACRTATTEERIAALEAAWNRAMKDWIRSWTGAKKK